MLWTVMEENAVMEGMDKITAAEEYEYENHRILGYPTSSGKVCITRVISSDPSVFLDPRFAPGNLVPAKKL